MTANQDRALVVALQLLLGERSAPELTDSEWQLLLLAAGVNNVSAPPDVVAKIILDKLESSDGYFGPHRPRGSRPAN